jgi:hypothetical protein
MLPSLGMTYFKQIEKTAQTEYHVEYYEKKNTYTFNLLIIFWNFAVEITVDR